MKLAETVTPTAYIVLCTQKRLFLVRKRLIHQILPINENTRTWFDILAFQKCRLHCFQFGSARLAMWIFTRSTRFNSVRSGSVRLGSACSVNEPLRTKYLKQYFPWIQIALYILRTILSFFHSRYLCHQIWDSSNIMESVLTHWHCKV